MGAELSLAANGGSPRPVADRADCPTPLFNVYRAGDGRWFVLVGVEADRHLPAVLAAVVVLHHPVAWVVGFVVMGRVIVCLNVVGHEAVHRTLFSNRAVNDWAGRWLASYPVFVAFESFTNVTPSTIATRSSRCSRPRYARRVSRNRSGGISHGSDAARAASAFDAFMSCHRSSAALNSNRPAMMAKSSQWPRKAEIAAAASIR